MFSQENLESPFCNLKTHLNDEGRRVSIRNAGENFELKITWSATF